jgi:hypothetical protein
MEGVEDANVSLRYAWREFLSRTRVTPVAVPVRAKKEAGGRG